MRTAFAFALILSACGHEIAVSDDPPPAVERTRECRIVAFCANGTEVEGVVDDCTNAVDAPRDPTSDGETCGALCPESAGGAHGVICNIDGCEMTSDETCSE